MATIDIKKKDAYYSVAIAPEHRQYLWFQWKGKLLQYTCFTNGLACCPRLFTKLLKPVYASLMARSHQSLNMFKSCLVKHGLKAAYWCFFTINSAQIKEHV